MPDSSHRTTTHEEAADIVASNPFVGNRLGFDGHPAVVEAVIVGRVVRVSFADGTTREFHHQWLRHSCYCQDCGNAADGIRFVTAISFESSIAPKTVGAAAGDLIVTWPDKHKSTYGPDWLLHHAYDAPDRARRAAWRPTLWKSNLSDHFPTVSVEEASDGGAGLLRLYHMLRDYGIVRVTGLRDGLDETERLASFVGPINETTVFGRIYDVRAEPVAKLGAKTGMAQAPHIDDAFYYAPPGIDVFHCLANTEVGGLSTYVDGFAIAEDIRITSPHAFELLTTLPISQIRWHPGEVDVRARGPLISIDEFGRPSGIRYFDRALAPLDVDPVFVEPLYDAIREFNQRMIDDEFLTQIRIAPGDGVLMDNHRVLHGRTAFDPNQGRHVRLCQVTRDEFHARLRELSRRLDPANHDIHLPSGSRA